MLKVNLFKHRDTSGIFYMDKLRDGLGPERLL
jgi:hypothetical protein